MQFTLVYEGDLPPNGNAAEKWRIRRAMEPQLRRLWTTPPIDGMGRYIDPTFMPNDSYIGRTVHGIEFMPLICSALSLRAEISVLLLSGELPGGLLHGGDIDNRFKTLLDALSIPQQPQQVPPARDVEPDNRLFCLLEDDRYVVRLDIQNDRLLTENPGSRNVKVIMRVRPVAFEVRLSNLIIAV